MPFGHDGITGDLTSVTDVMGQPWAYFCDDGANPHRMTRIVDPRGVTVMHTEYDARSRAYRQYDPAGNLALELTFNGDGTTTLHNGTGDCPSTTSRP